jgi:tetratricopeptide (TPR) repeat protein
MKPMRIEGPLLNRLLQSKNISIALAAGAAFGLYAGALWNGFTFDDRLLALENPWIKDVRFVTEIFTSSLWSFHPGSHENFYRPLMHLIYMANWYLFGLEPWSFHLVKVLFHAGSTVMVLLVTADLLKGDLKEENTTTGFCLPFIAALLFAAHPAHADAVVNGITEVSFSFFCLLSFYLYIKGGARATALSAVSFFLATLCKETALTLPLLLVAFDYAYKKSRTLYGHARNYAPYAFVCVAYFVLRTNALGGFAPTQRHANLGPYEYVINVFPLVKDYLVKLAAPVNLKAAYAFHPVGSLMEPQTIAGLAAAAAFMGAIYVVRRRSPVLLLSLLWIIIPLLPALYIPALGDHAFTERYLYLPSTGFVIILSLAFVTAASGFSSGRSRRGVLILLVLATLAMYSTVVIKRVPVWKDNLTLWTDTVAKSPDDHISHNNLGSALYDLGRLDEAAREFKAALGIYRHFVAAYNNLGLVYLDKGLHKDAIGQFKTGLALKPDTPDLLTNLGLAYFKLGRIEDAVEKYGEALRLNPSDDGAHYNLGLAYQAMHLPDKAIKEYKEALRLRPGRAEAHNNLGITYYGAGRTREAIAEFERAVSLAPGLAEAHYNLGIAYGDLGDKERAYEHIKRAMDLSKELGGEALDPAPGQEGGGGKHGEGGGGH